MTIIKRIFKQGAKSWVRNKTVSISSIFILTITLIIFSSILLWNAIFNNSIDKLENKVDISIYIRPDLDSDNQDVLNLKNKISKMSEVSNISFISKEDAFIKYKEENVNNPAISESLNFIGNNPFGSRFLIKAKTINDYGILYSNIQKGIEVNNLSDIIYKINYVDIKSNIDNLQKLTIWFSNVGLMIVGLFVIMSILIIYNTTRISIFVFRNEIGVMKLVGASNFFIRGPFLVEAGISGAISAVVATLVSYPISYYISTKSLTFLGGFDILRYYESNVLLLFVILFIFSFIVSIVSSFLATRKYLKR